MDAAVEPLIQEFSASAGSVGAVVVPVDGAGVVAHLDGLGASDAGPVGASLAVRDAFPAVSWPENEHAAWPPVAVSLAPLGIAQTGSVVLAERTYHDRLMSLLCERHIVVLRSRDLVPSPADVVPWMRRSRLPYVTFATGPSRTSDIERVLTIGVHGPRELVIVLVR